jgi:AraC-like DNA-binding protein
MPSRGSSIWPDVPTTNELALQMFVRELQWLAGDLPFKDPYELGLRLVNAVAVLPSNLGPLIWWTVRGLSTEAFVRLSRKGGWHCCELELRCDVSASSSPRDLADLLLWTLQISRERAARRAGGRLDNRIERAIAYIRANCTRPSLVVEDVARHVRLSRWHLSRLLVRSLGASYRVVLRCARMEEAERLLRDDALSVKEVAASVGYPHATELDRAFKQYFGVTPTEWRALRGTPASGRADDWERRGADHADRPRVPGGSR